MWTVPWRLHMQVPQVSRFTKEPTQKTSTDYAAFIIRTTVHRNGGPADLLLTVDITKWMKHRVTLTLQRPCLASTPAAGRFGNSWQWPSPSPGTPPLFFEIFCREGGAPSAGLKASEDGRRA